MSKSFEEQILSDVVKQVMTPEKINALAVRLGPQIEKKFEKEILDAVDVFINDIDMRDVFYDSDDLQDYFESILRKALGMPASSGKKKRR